MSYRKPESRSHRFAARAQQLARLGALLSLMAILWGGCGDDFAPETELNNLRILGIRAEPPEVHPGETVTLDALVWTPPGAEGEAPVAPVYSWRVCYLATSRVPEVVIEGGAEGVDGNPSSCFDLKESLTLEELLALPEDADLDFDETAIDLGAEPSADFWVFPLPTFPAPPSYCGHLSEEEQVEQGGREMWVAGLRMMASLRVSWEGQSRTANKRLLIRPDAGTIREEQQGQPFRTPRLCESAEGAALRCARNENPELPVLEAPNGEWDGQGPIVLSPGEQIKLRPVRPSEEDLQTYLAMKLCGIQQADPELLADGGEYERSEARWWYWYSDGGEVVEEGTSLDDDPVMMETAWVAPEDASPGERFSIWTVAIDGRGGISWSETKVEIR